MVFTPPATPEPDREIPLSHRWPFRGLAFASDLGTVSYLVNQPRLGHIGWLLSLPYYAVSILKAPSGNKRHEEILYQATANGLFPYAEAKLGMLAGEQVSHQVQSFLKKHAPASQLRKLAPSVYKLLGGLGALILLTPRLGDPLSHWLISQYRQRRDG